MGSEQSTEAAPQKSKGSRIGQLKRGKSVPEQNRQEQEIETSRPGSCSPGLSVCSDSELPYISYTVNRPIGDSPKHPAKQGHLLRGKSLGANISPSRKSTLRKTPLSRVHNVVVVKPAAKEESTEKDPEILRLQKIPMFLPIMRSTLNVPAARDPEILERFDPRALHRLCLRCQRHMTESALSIANEQDRLGLRLKEINSEIAQTLAANVERQKRYSKHAETLSKVSELTAQIAKCHFVLNKTLESVEKLNNLLPPDERLEPFVWTTG
ncbi:unnamed protein product [Nezara viridula]|uniref:BLOC-1-related complex subunit 5 n=1 Tax=Nezara viridula TaxID=85310 RepID=A0A9P0HIG4_NEZVI|nr:unnamed protein product [Nezara viridula]